MTKNDDTHLTSKENRALARYVVLRFCMIAGNQMLAVAVGYQLFQLTGSAFWLGLAGLVQFLPKIIFLLQSGTIADRFDRRIIVVFTQATVLVSVLVLGATSFLNEVSPVLLLIIVFCYGTAFAMEGPAVVSLLPNLVRKKRFAKAAATSNSFTQAATILGPAVAGFLYILGPYVVYWTIAVLNVLAMMMALSIRPRHILAHAQTSSDEGSTDGGNKPQNGLSEALAGFRYIWQQKGIFGALSLDMFAVLFGGVTALLPIFAEDILHVGSTGFGFLRAAPSIGAVLFSTFLAARPLQHNTGKKMFAAVAVFGIVTILFALTNNFALAIILLIILGAADSLSVIVRTTYVQLKTPDELRGRVSAVNLIFIGASNQLGEFESGLVATLFGSVITATVLGGIGTLVVTAVWYKLFTELRELDKL